MSRVRIKLLDENCMPTRAHKWDAGWDLKAMQEVTIKPGETVKVNTGIQTEIPGRFFGMLVARSGLGTKHNLTLANDVGIIDSEYRGDIIAALTNNGKEEYTINQYDRFAQLLIIPVNTAEIVAVQKLSGTNRGDAGFGSTGIKKDIPVGMLEGKSEVLENKKADKRSLAELEREKKLEELRQLKPADYMKLKNSGELFDKYPIATGDIQVDLEK
jgi:dUTP pyrophosphatase